jgi:hypothetical protein
MPLTFRKVGIERIGLPKVGAVNRCSVSHVRGGIILLSDMPRRHGAAIPGGVLSQHFVRCDALKVGCTQCTAWTTKKGRRCLN